MSSTGHSENSAGKSAPRRYEFFEHTADVGVRVFGASLEELFRNGAAALYDTLGRWRGLPQRRERCIQLDAERPEDLWRDWLGELLFDFSAHGVVYDQFEFQELTPQRLRAIARGSLVDWRQSEPHTEIKAVTYHRLRVTPCSDGRWIATVIFDV